MVGADFGDQKLDGVFINTIMSDRKSERVYFENADGIRLAGILDYNQAGNRAFALFSHCFTCNKDLKAIVKISRRLAEHGIAVLRFDFEGLGDSKGSFSDSNLETNLRDVRAAVEFLAAHHEPPQLLIGHSLGGSAMLTLAEEVDSARALVTIASPSTTEHLIKHLSSESPAIVSEGEGEVVIGGRTWLIKKQFLENLAQYDLNQSLKELTKPHFIIHPSTDETLAYWHAEKMFELTGGPKSVLTLDESDHLLVVRADDAVYVANMIASWVERYLA